MATVVPVPVSQQTDAAAAPFTLTASSRIVADASLAGVAAIAAQSLAPVIGRSLPITVPTTLPAASDTADSTDIVLESVGADAQTGLDTALDAVAPSLAAESYTLRAGADGVRITAPGEAGLFYGVQTLAQLLEVSGDTWQVAATRITDAPRFGYRGVMLDVARHFFGVDVVKRYIDQIAALKLNTLHLHLTDDQGWRIHLDSRPDLTAKASSVAVGGDEGGFYTKADYADIVAYAAARHVTVVPEVDGPGHTHSVGLAYPELAEQPAITDAVRETVAQFGGELPAPGIPYDGFAVGFSSLKIRDEATYAFLADVFGELAAMTPGPYLHVGGDEALGTSPADFAEYLTRVTHLVSDLGKTPVSWHEAGAVADISDDTVGQYWGLLTPQPGMDEQARAFVRNGSKIVLSPADAVYLDMKTTPDSPTGLTWANGPTSVERSYRWEPTAVIAGISEQDILGVEAPLWTETVRTETDLQQQAFPRVASAAEVAWSPAPDASPERDWESFRVRLGALAPLWRAQHVDFFASDEVPWAQDVR